MCGIVAIFAYHGSAPNVESDELITIRDHMASRGPDGVGEWLSPNRRIGLGHRRLSIIDLSPTGAQPMFNEEQSIGVVFNGEIYNYRELRAKLGKKGYRFRSESDTEVLLHLYADRSEEMLNDVRGMYAFAIWDARKDGMLLARDPFGIKPLYYSDDGKTLRAASQVRALTAGKHIDLTPSPAGHVGYFLWGHVPEPFTLYKEISSLPAGGTLWIDRSGRKCENTFDRVSDILATTEETNARPTGPDASVASLRLRTALIDSVRHHLISDVPVGVFLSSGLDSTTLAALAAEQGGDLRTVTLGFDEYKGTTSDETLLAEKFAQTCGASHQTIWVSRADFQAHRDHLFASMDQPSTDGVNTFFVSFAAKQAGLKVALSGVGGDEVFAGYPSFREVPRMVEALQLFRHLPLLGKTVRVIIEPILKHYTSPKYAGLFEFGGTYAGAYLLRRGMFMPWELPDLLGPEIVREGWRELQTLLRLEETVNGLMNPRLKVSSLEMGWYMRNQLLRDSDWAGMAHSLEIRVPLVDLTLLRDIAPLLATENPPGKQDMALTPSQRMPDEILQRAKTGFSIPVREWLLDKQPSSHDRGLRGWAKQVYARFHGVEARSVLPVAA